MTKLFLLQSKSKKNEPGDVIINLDMVITYSLIKKDNEFFLGLRDSADNKTVAIFSDEKDARDTLGDIFSKLGQDTTMAYKIKFIDRREKDILQDILKEVLSR